MDKVAHLRGKQFSGVPLQAIEKMETKTHLSSDLALNYSSTVVGYIKIDNM